ncbi:T9SS type A sorting domain-containing protein [Chryseobacterium arthrosphaerae]|uniref:RCC1 domain-containing protein n=1 Tax=Chryseobacterium arthrosphaerae TaxID=651561 RepID=UPI0023E29C5B|nr:T9SS type A sorting domain-containing protein [Chryseobacterium arthrosphaerae]WES98168.1 T9SS type A sorting domain-containing protein [Chryseobacterium arthrosphaerae]
MGNKYALAIKTDGTLWAWGSNTLGQIGDGTTVAKMIPTQVGNETNWKKAIASDNHSMGIRTDGTLWAWGWNTYGQLGDGTTIKKSTPVQIGTATDWLNAASKNAATYATKTDGTLWSWGYNYYGQLGHGISGQANGGTSPLQVGFSSDNLSIYAGENYALVETIDGNLKSCGQNNYGQLGDGTTISKNTFISISCPEVCIAPTQLATTNITATSATIYWTAASQTPSKGYQYLYSTNPLMGGNNGATVSSTVHLTNLLPNTTYYWWVAPDCGFSQVVWLPGGSFTTLSSTEASCWQSASAGAYYSLGLKNDGTLWAWGDNYDGSLGDGTFIDRYTPVKIGSSANWTKICAGLTHAAGIKTDGTLWTWGYNYNGQLGDGTTIKRNTPAQIGSDTDWITIAGGNAHTVAIKMDGTLWAWGDNRWGQLGDGTNVNKSVPIQVGTATDWKSVASKGNHTLAIKTDGTLWGWGDNTYGQLGNGTLTASNVPVQIGTSANWVAAEGARLSSIGIKTDGTLWTWGDNRWGQLGDGTLISKIVPTQIGTETDWQNFSIGFNSSTIATKTDGTLWTWGYNALGQLGDGTQIHRSVPTLMLTSTDWQTVAAGAQNTLAINSSGLLAISGDNGHGQIGDDTIIQKKIFTPVKCSGSTMVSNRISSNKIPLVGIPSLKDYQLKVYPNPVYNVLTITYERKISSVTVYDMAGRQVLSKIVNDNKTTLDFSNLLPGVYQLMVNDGEVGKMVKVIKR